MEYIPQERYEIMEKKEIAPSIFLHRIKAPLIANRAKAGNFIILMADEKAERIPITIVDWSSKEGWIEVIIQTIGNSTAKMNLLEKGDFFAEAAGPLGSPVNLKKYGTIAAVGGGVGIAELYPIAKAFKQAGNRIISILGARNKDLLILEKETSNISDLTLITTDDGSKGRKGLVTDALKDICEKEKIDAVFTIGPPVMMKFTVMVAKEKNIPAFASLNPIMLDATGMCGGCRVEIAGETKFACVEGPMFEAHNIDFDTLIKRNSAYKDMEKASLENFEKTHKCRIGLH